MPHQHFQRFNLCVEYAFVDRSSLDFGLPFPNYTSLGGNKFGALAEIKLYEPKISCKQCRVP